MIAQNPLLKFGLIFLKILAILMSVLLLIAVFMAIDSGGKDLILFPGIGIIVSIIGIVVILAIANTALWALIFLLSKVIKPLR